MPGGAKVVIVVKALVEHGVSLALGHGVEFAFVVVPQTDVFHGSPPRPLLFEASTARLIFVL
jgi:hypothetical protein